MQTKPWTKQQDQAYCLSRYGHKVLWVNGTDGLMYNEVDILAKPQRHAELVAARDKRVQDAAYLLMDRVLEKQHMDFAVNTPMRKAVMLHIHGWMTLRLGGKYNVTYRGETITVWMHSDTLVSFHYTPNPKS